MINLILQIIKCGMFKPIVIVDTDSYNFLIIISVFIINQIVYDEYRKEHLPCKNLKYFILPPSTTVTENSSYRYCSLITHGVSM